MQKKEKVQKPGKACKLKYLFYDIGRVLLTPFIWLYFRPKIIYEDKAAQKLERKQKKTSKRLMIVSNHNSYMTIPIFFALFFRRRIHCVMATEVANKPIKRWFYSTVCTIPVDRHKPIDINCINKAVAALNDERAVTICPEGGIHRVDEVLPYKAGFAIMALQGKAPIMPIYIMRRKNFFRRTRVAIGKTIDISEICDGKLNTANADAIVSCVHSKTEELKALCFAKKTKKAKTTDMDTFDTKSE